MLATPVRRFGATATRSLATPAAAPKHHRIVVVGAGAAGSSAAHQLLASKLVGSGEIAVVEPSQHHHYQPGWTLVGAGIRKKTDLRRPVADILDKRLTHYTSAVQTFEPERNVVNLGDRSLSYDQLIVCPGIEIKIDAVKGLRDALTDERTPVGTIYKYVSAAPSLMPYLLSLPAPSRPARLSATRRGTWPTPSAVARLSSPNQPE